MNWSDVSIGKKLNIGFGILVIMIIGISIFSVLEMGNIVFNASEVINGNKFRDDIIFAEVSHLKWVEKISEFLIDKEISELNLEMNDHECAFGKWLYSNENKEAEKQIPSLSKYLSEIEYHHKQLHESAKEIKEKAVKNFEECNKVNHIYAEKLIPAMDHIQGLLGNIKDEISKCTITDRVMLNKAAYAKRITIIISIFAVIIGIFLAIFVPINIKGPITKAINFAKLVAKGDVSQSLDINQKDEIGQLANNLNIAVKGMDDKSKITTSIAFGDLTVNPTITSNEDTLGKALRDMVQSLNEIMLQISNSVDQIASGASQVSYSSQSVSQGATEQASAIEQITSSMNEMGSQTNHNAENANQANQLANEARNAAHAGNEHMRDMVCAMNEINESGKNISKIIKVIDEIAFQTNLLALNAAVEAARAGKHGKGFAVVAEEVRNLASRSAKAAKETAELIEGSVKKTENGTEIAYRTAEALNEILMSVTKVTDLVGEIAASSNDQAQGIAQVNQGLEQIEQVAQQSTANAEESASASEELSSQAVHLKGLLHRFKLKNQQRSFTQAINKQFQYAMNNYPSIEAANCQEITHTKSEIPKMQAQTSTDPAQIIALDDQEFGKY